MKRFIGVVFCVVFAIAGCADSRSAEEKAADEVVRQQKQAAEEVVRQQEQAAEVVRLQKLWKEAKDVQLHARIVTLEDGHDYAVFQNAYGLSSIDTSGGITAMHAVGCRACNKKNEVAEKE